MRMQVKLTLFFLFIGLVSACTVGAVAYWLETLDFRKAIMEEAFQDFEQDLRAYLVTYGDYETAKLKEPFERFVRRRRLYSIEPEVVPSDPPGRRADGDGDKERPPFHFLVMSPSGIVLTDFEEYPVGVRAPESIIGQSSPVTLHGRIVVLAYPIGTPQLTPRHKNFLIAMRHSIGTGVGVAVVLAIVLGVVLGRRLSFSLIALTNAIRLMQEDREKEQSVTVSSNDELGELAGAFNQMNRELTQAHRELRELSIRDELTGLFNRRHFDEQARMLFEQAVRYRQPLSVMIGDLDHFKRINDTFSHDAGDQVLQRVAMLLENGTRRSDVVARYGGEEFVIIFPNSILDEAAGCCEQIRKKVETVKWDDIHPELHVTMSMGITGNLALGSAEAMIRMADQNLYRAKDMGRNRVIASNGVHME